MDASILMNRMHNISIGIQFLLLIPVVMALQKLSQNQPPRLSQSGLAIGMVAIGLVALLSLLTLPESVSDIFYMLPQGLFGLWLIFFCLNMRGVISKGLRRFGFVVGVGLTLVGCFFVGYVLLVSTLPLHIPAASLEEASKIPVTTANSYLHYFLDVGSLLGVLLFPVWIILMGSKLFTQKVTSKLTPDVRE